MFLFINFQLTAFFAPLPTSQAINSSASIYIQETITALDSHPLIDIANVTPGQPKLPLSGIWRPHSIMSPITGVRRSADQILDRTNPNLEIRLNSNVQKITFNQNNDIPTAQCVMYKQGRRRRNLEACVNEGGRIFLAAGAIHTPVLLMKSGIGKAGEIYDNDKVGQLVANVFELSFDTKRS